MTNIRKTKSLHHITVEGCSIGTFVQCDINTASTYIYTAKRHISSTKKAVYNKQRVAPQTKAVHHVVVEGCDIATRVSYNMKTGHVGVTSSHRYVDPADSGEYQKMYRIENKEACMEYWKQYRIDNKEKISVFNRRYNSDNKENLAAYHARYYLANKESIAAWNKQYQRDNPKEVRRYVTPVKSCNHLNKWFDGCRRHHIDPDTIVHIPADMHIHHPHNIQTGDGMGVINMLAFGFLFGQVEL